MGGTFVSSRTGFQPVSPVGGSGKPNPPNTPGPSPRHPLVPPGGVNRLRVMLGAILADVVAFICVIAVSVVTCGCSGNPGAGAPTQLATPCVDRSPDPVKRGANAVLASSGYPTHSLRRRQVQRDRSEPSGIPTLVRVYSADKASLSAYCHILLHYGLGPTDLPSLASGDLALKALTDERAAVATFGKNPFVRTRHGLRYLLSNDPVFHSDVGESHRDQCLATFAALDLPLDTPITLDCRSYSVSDLLSESVANFSLDQKELAWTALAFAKYLPPQKEWITRFGDRVSFSQLVRSLIHRDFNTESCAGTHLLQALIQIDNADHGCSLLDHVTRDELDSHLTAIVHEVVGRQRDDGSWDWQWSYLIDDVRLGATPPFQVRVLVTAHLLEALMALDSRRRPSDAIYERAGKWLRQSLDSKNITRDGSWICPFTHAARAAGEILIPAG